MEDIDAQINTVKKSSFASHVLNFDENTKNELTNIVQYILLAIIPVLMLNKIIENLIPQFDESKGSLEVLIEVVAQMSLTLLAVFLIHRVITFIPTYSKTEHKTVSIVTLLLVLLLVNNEIRAKLNLLFDRVSEKLGNKKEPMKVIKESKQKQNVVSTSQPGISPPQQHQPSRSDVYITERAPPADAQPQAGSGFNNLADGLGMAQNIPMAANEGYGAFSGF